MKQKKKQKAENYEFIPTGKSRKKGLISYFFPALTVIAALLILGCLGLLIYVFVPGGLNPGLGRGKLQVCLEGDQLLLTWPETINASACRIYMYDLEQKDYVLYGEYTGNSLTMEGVRPNQEILLQLQAVRYTVNRMGNPCERMSRKKSVTVRPVHLDRPVLQEELDPQKMNLTVNWNSGTGNLYEVFWLDENDVWQSVRVVGKDSIRLSFGDDIDMPGQERPARVAVRTLRRGDDCVYYSALSDVIVVERDDLSGTLLALSYEEIGDRLYRMSWEETRGDTYEVQQWSERENAWLTRAVLDWSQERVYETDRLPSGTTVRFRVVAYRKDERENEEDFTVQPEVLSFRTGISTL